MKNWKSAERQLFPLQGCQESEGSNLFRFFKLASHYPQSDHSIAIYSYVATGDSQTGITNLCAVHSFPISL